MKKINNLKDKAGKIIKSQKINNHILEEVLNYYTEAIDLKVKDKINAKLYSNRAWVNLKLERKIMNFPYKSKLVFNYNLTKDD